VRQRKSPSADFDRSENNFITEAQRGKAATKAEKRFNHKAHKDHIEKRFGFGEFTAKLVLSECEGTEPRKVRKKESDL
jgi:hypothetical protein